MLYKQQWRKSENYSNQPEIQSKLLNELDISRKRYPLKGHTSLKIKHTIVKIKSNGKNLK